MAPFNSQEIIPDYSIFMCDFNKPLDILFCIHIITCTCCAKNRVIIFTFL